MSERPRVLLAKPGLDGHDRGVKVIGMALRDAGAEVVYLGLQQTAAAIVAAAVAEDVDVIGLSVLSGVHLRVTADLIAARAKAGIEEVPVVVGGTIPPKDTERLKELGASGVYPVGTPLDSVVKSVLQLARGA
jgi:methylmalonyl-CoA mutase, C-terminal domain